MKKSKLLKKVAYTAPPQLSDGFVPPDGYGHKIIVSLQNVDIKVHGFNGTSWEQIVETNEADNVFTSDISHQKYYFESKTGVEQIVRTYFLSSEEEAPLQLELGATHETRKFHHIEEVPTYYGSDEGKMLTIMSDGSLRWLGINESYIVEVIGTGGEGTGTSHVSAHLEENGTLFGNAAIVDGILVSEASGDYTRLAMTDDYRSSVNQTISFWFKSTYNPSNGNWMRFVHSHIIGQGPNGFFVEMRSPTKIYFKGATQGLLADSDPTAEAPYALNDGEWHQITVSWQDSGSEALRMWVDGQPLTVLNETHVGSGADTKPYLFIGARQFGSPMEMDKVGITEEFIDDAEALARYNSEAPAEAPAATTLLGQSTAFGDASYNASTDVMTFDGTGDYATFDGGHAFTDAVTYGAWFRTTATGDRRIMSSHVRSAPSHNGYFIMLNNGTLEYRRPNQTFFQATGPSGLNDGNWHFFAVSWLENGDSFAYLDGTQIASFGGGVATGYIEGWDLYIGANPWLGSDPYGNFLGDIGGAFVKNEAMTLEQVQAIYDNGPE